MKRQKVMCKSVLSGVLPPNRTLGREIIPCTTSRVYPNVCQHRSKVKIHRSLKEGDKEN